MDPGCRDSDLLQRVVSGFSAAWYRRGLARHFRTLGGGLFLHREADAVLYALESW